MKAATITELKKELQYRSHQELLSFCLALARFKLESKELLTYLVFESDNEDRYITGVKDHISGEFKAITTHNYYYTKKSVRKILRQTKRYIRYSRNKETEARVLIHFCRCMTDLKPNIGSNKVLRNMYLKQREMAEKAISRLHEDLQYDILEKWKELPVL